MILKSYKKSFLAKNPFRSKVVWRTKKFLNNYYWASSRIRGKFDISTQIRYFTEPPPVPLLEKGEAIRHRTSALRHVCRRSRLIAWLLLHSSVKGITVLKGPAPRKRVPTIYACNPWHQSTTDNKKRHAHPLKLSFSSKQPTETYRHAGFNLFFWNLQIGH